MFTSSSKHACFAGCMDVCANGDMEMYTDDDTHIYVTRSHKMVHKSIFGATEILIYHERGENADYYGEKNYCGQCKAKEVMAS